MSSCDLIADELAALRAEIGSLNNKFATKQDLINLEQIFNSKYSALESRVKILENKISKIDIVEGLINGLKDLLKFIQQLAEKAVSLANEALNQAMNAIGEALIGKASAAEAKGVANNAISSANDARNLGEKARDLAGEALIKAGEAIAATKPILSLERRVEVLEAEFQYERKQLDIVWELAHNSMELAIRNTQEILAVRQTARAALADADDARRTVDYLYPKVIATETKVIATETKVNTIESDVNWMKLQIISFTALFEGIQGEIFLIQGQIAGLVQANLMMEYQILSINMSITRIDGEVLKAFNTSKQALSSAENAVNKVDRLSNQVYELDGQVTIITNEVSDLWYTVSDLKLRINNMKLVVNNYYPTKYETILKYETIVQPKETIVERPYPVPQPVYTTIVQPTQYKEVHTIELQPIQTTIIKPTEIRTLREIRTLEKTIVERPYPVPQPIYYTNTIVENKYNTIVQNNTIREILPLQTIQNNITNTIVKPTEIRTIQKTETREVEMIRWIDIQVETISCELQSEKWTAKTNMTTIKVMGTATGNEINKIQTEFRELAKTNRELCEAKNRTNEDSYAVVPEWWQVRTFQKPQLVIQYAEVDDQGKMGRSRWAVTIPHYNKPESFTPKFPTYQKGDYEGILVLNDNSKIIINAVSNAECTRVINILKQYIDPNFLKDIKPPKIGERPASYKKCTVKPVRCHFFLTGQKDAIPTWSKSLIKK